MEAQSNRSHAMGTAHGSGQYDAARFSDASILLVAEARELVRHRSAGGSDEYVKKRALVVNKLYGECARDAIRELMKTIKQEDES